MHQAAVNVVQFEVPNIAPRERSIEEIDRKTVTYAACIMLTIASLTICAATASKIYEVSFFGLRVLVPVGTSLFCLSFLATDIISEIWGRNHALLVAMLGLCARILSAAFFGIAIWIPGHESWLNQEAYSTVLGASTRILIGGILGYFAASVLDAYVFHYLRERHKGKNLLFVRNNVSTFTAQLLGAVIFVIIGFYGAVPNEALYLIVAGNVAVKWVTALIDTPLVYIVRNYTEHRPLLDLRG